MAFWPFFDATVVLVRMLLSSVAMMRTFLLDALGVLMLPNRTADPPPAFEQPPIVVTSAAQATAGTR